ncbi:MAG TPA: pilus (MSHA type) biogenesis protein MshL [Marinobacter sp.]|nr:pilus (MSHA type) biogenesis protein MshL [Marinobacter sp.]
MTKTSARGLLIALLAIATTACSNNPMMRSSVATSSDVADQIDEALAKAESAKPLPPDHASPRPPSLPAEIRQALLPPLEPDIASEERFDVNASGVAADRFFAALVQDTPYNVAVHPDVDDSITLRLSNVTVPEVMDIAEDLYGLDIQRTGRLYRVGVRQVQARLFSVDYLNFKRRGGSETRVSSGQVSSARSSDSSNSDTGSQDSQTRNLVGTTISTNTESDFWQGITMALNMIVGQSGGQVVVNPGAGLVMVRASTRELDLVEDYLRRTELIMQRQVVLEAKILEVALNEGYQQGINWADVQSAAGRENYFTAQSLQGPEFRVPEIGGVFSAAVSAGDFSGLIELLGEQGNVQILSSPRIATVNNQKAVIKVGTDEFFVTDIDFNDNNSAVAATDRTSTSVELTPFFSGISLDVTPQISRDGSIILHVHPSVSEVNDQEKLITIGEQDVTLPLARSTVRETDSVVRAESGQIVVIGGLIQSSSEDDNSAVPFLSDIPLVGELFKQRRYESTKSELVILLRPVVADAEQMRADVSASRERMNVLRELLNSAESVKPQPETAPR